MKKKSLSHKARILRNLCIRISIFNLRCMDWQISNLRASENWWVYLTINNCKHPPVQVIYCHQVSPKGLRVKRHHCWTIFRSVLNICPQLNFLRDFFSAGRQAMICCADHCTYFNYPSGPFWHNFWFSGLATVNKGVFLIDWTS